MTRLVRNTQSREQFTDDKVFFVLPVTGNFFLWQEIFSCDKKYSFLHGKNILWHDVFFSTPVTGNKFPVTWNILLFTGKISFVKNIILLLSQEVFFLSHFALSQEIFFLLDKEIIFSCDTRCIFPVTRTIFLVWENSSLLSLGRFRCITFSRQMCGIYNQNFLWDLKISWEPGSQVPRDYPTLGHSTTIPREKK